MNKKLDFSEYIMVPKSVIFSGNLSWTEKCMFVALLYLSNNKQEHCFASNQYLAALMGVNERTICRQIKQLALKNLIIIKTTRRKTHFGQFYMERKIFINQSWQELLNETINPLQEYNIINKIYGSNNNFFSKIKNVVDSNNKLNKIYNNINTKNIDCILIDKDFKINWSDPVFKEYQHLKPFEYKLKKWLLKMKSGEIYNITDILKLLIRFYKRNNSLQSSIELAMYLSPTKDDWDDFQEMIKKKRGIRQRTFKEIMEELKTRNLPTMPTV